MRIVIFSMLVAASASAGAQQFYRCTDSAGKVTLSDKVCDAGAADASRFVLKPNTLDSREGRAQDLRDENQRLREQLNRQGQQGYTQPAQQQYGRTRSDLQAEKAGSLECQRATRNLEVATSSRTPGGTSRSSAEMAMRAACGMPEPAGSKSKDLTCFGSPGGGIYNCW